MRIVKKDFLKRSKNIKNIEITFFQNVLLNTPYLTNIQKQKISHYIAQRKNFLTYTTKNICLNSGLEKSIISDFRISRHLFKKHALQGNLPGIKKASW